MEVLQEIVIGIIMLLVTLAIIGLLGWIIWKRERRSTLSRQIEKHFQPSSLSQLVVSERQFPVHIRADLQHAIDEFIDGADVRYFTGIQKEFGFGGVDFTSLLDESLIQFGMGTKSGPPQYEHIDVGEDEPVRTLQNGFWLLERNGIRLAILYAPVSEMGSCGPTPTQRIQIAVPDEAESKQCSEEFLRHLEVAVENAKCYRGKVLSLEKGEEYSGQSVGVKVHRLGSVDREEVILPAKTLELLERNVLNFIEHRDQLAQHGMTIKKGLLFYGPPGTGKTHTIRYLSHALEDHTTLLIAAEQVALLGPYMTLARLLQPSVVVIEDVDLIARERSRMNDPNAELLLNKLLNEMDGLREDSAILFILTTNRPAELEGALASRPGRIDQAIEFPLPDREGRRKLIRLYAGKLELSDEVIEQIAGRTDGVSASFIKELMRHSAQYCFQRGSDHRLAPADVEQALDEMLFSGGSLNLKLLGGDQWREGE